MLKRLKFIITILIPIRFYLLKMTISSVKTISSKSATGDTPIKSSLATLLKITLNI
mgnify:CR=1 FL=1